MKKNIYLKAFLFFLLPAFTLFTSGQGFSPQVQKHFQKVIDSFQNNPANPFMGGMSVAIKVDGLALWQGATGFAARNIDDQNNLLPGGMPFNTNTLSRIYSITKTFTAPLVLELIKEGVFRLEDPVSKFLPLNLINPGLDGSVTIKQLLAHESGYSDYTDELNLQIAVAAQPTHVWTPFEMLTFVHQIDPRGAVRKYSSTNYIVLGAIIELATGKHVEEFYRSRFFDPLHLKSMYLAIRESAEGHGSLASPHDNISPFNPVFQQTGQPTFPDTITNIRRFPITAIASLAFTGGGIVSDAKDVAEWGSALFSGRAAGKDITNTMLKSISETPDEDGDRLGYGVILSNKISGVYDFYGHDGNAPGYRSIMFYQPNKKLTLVILTNYHGADIYAIARALYADLPDFSCGNNKKENDKIQVCFNGNNLCIAREAAPGFISKGAYLGSCERENNQNSETSIFEKEDEKANSLSAFPNPFTNNLAFTFKSKEAGNASLKLYEMSGNLSATLFNGFVQKGSFTKVKFDGSRLPAGTYMVRLQTTSGTSVQKIMKIH
ncbi:MAG: serine hydrolase [Bacteroidota bacterium]|nr:serine hydrolase [Bacteroidota bacterium]